MTPIIHRVNDIKLLKDLPNNYGLEIDVRSNNNNLILSHEPTDQGDLFIDFIEEYNHQLLVVNVKEAGIDEVNKDLAMVVKETESAVLNENDHYSDLASGLESFENQSLKKNKN